MARRKRLMTDRCPKAQANTVDSGHGDTPAGAVYVGEGDVRLFPEEKFKPET